MVCALSPNFSTLLHHNQWSQIKFAGTYPVSIRLCPPPRHHVTLVARSKFDKFDSSDVVTSDTNGGDEGDPVQELEELEDDSCLPSDLVGAVRQSGEASASFVNVEGLRAIVELLIPELQFLNEEGAQAQVWELSRVFLETLIKESGGTQKVKAIFPDAGVAALLKYQWTDAKFGFASLGDRNPVDKEDDIVVMIIPDYQMVEKVEIIANRLSDDPVPSRMLRLAAAALRVLVAVRDLKLTFSNRNPRLVSGDVGVGFNVRNLRKMLLSTFTTVYSMKPLEAGAIFRCYPSMWKEFYDDVTRPNRYLLSKELQVAPTSTDIEIIFRELAGESEEKDASIIDQAMGVFSSFNRFMKAISK